jgi:predicted AAA+ superfamily ATPase
MSDNQTYVPRLLGPSLEDRLGRFPVVVLTGARQTGKTTLVRKLPGSRTRTYVTLDSLTSLDRARREPEALAASASLMTIDEVQRAPELLLAVKREVDRDRSPGRYLLTGSANLLLQKNVADSLGGRAVYLTLRPLTEREKRRDRSPAPWGMLLAAAGPREALERVGPARGLDWRRAALEGGLPPAAMTPDSRQRSLWLEGYVDTTVTRDLRDLTQVADLGAFVRFLRLVVLRCGGLVNHAELGREAGVSAPTAQRWLSLLETTYAVTRLPPFTRSRSKRLIRTSKLYAGDTGLGLFLCGIETAEELAEDRGGGCWLENLVLNDLLAWRETEARKPGVFFRRTAGGEEVDFVIEGAKRLLPIEVKASAAVRVPDAAALDSFCEEHGAAAPFGLLVHGGTEAFPLTKRALAVPLGAIL